MPEFSQEMLIQFFGQFAYEPLTVYALLVGLMVLSSFGFPVPEEVTLVSVGLVAFFATHPEIYPPPYPDASPVSPLGLAIVAFFAVFLSDVLVYALGRRLGYRAIRHRFFRRLISRKNIRRFEKWSSKYGALAAGIFRFTPGLRFPGHFMCGASKLPFTKFAAVDGTAALLSVPTQVLLIAFYGEEILSVLKQLKIVILVVLVLGGIYYLFRRFSNRTHSN